MPLLYTSTQYPGTSFAHDQFYQAFPRISTASDKCIKCHHELLQQCIWHKLCSHHHQGPYLLLQFACTWSFPPREVSPIQVVSCAVAHSLPLSLQWQSIFNVCKGIDIHMHTVLLIPTVHNHLVEVIFYLTRFRQVHVDPWSVPVYTFPAKSFKVEILHYIIRALYINGEWHRLTL